MEERKWEIEVIYPDGDFQCRILEKGVLSGGQYGDPRNAIIVGEPSKRGGHANIHDKDIAELIASAPTLKKQNDLFVLGLLQEKNKNKVLVEALENLVRGQLQMPSQQAYLDHAVAVAKSALKKAGEL